MAVISLLDLTLRPDVTDAEERIRRVLVDTRAFPGCLGVEVVRDAKDPLHLIAVERWESIEHDDAYRAWRATPEGANELGELVATPLVLTRLEVTDI